MGQWYILGKKFPRRCKPDSVIRQNRIVIHLSIPVREFFFYEDAAYPKPSGGPPGSLFRLASDWVYNAHSVTLVAVSSYPTISPLLAETSGLFSVALAVNLFCRKFPSLSQGILSYDVRTFLYSVKAPSSE